MTGKELRRRRIERGLTQDQVANAIETADPRRRAWERGPELAHRWDQNEDLSCITQAMVSAMENGREPIPRTKRTLDSGRKLLSIHDALDQLLSLPDKELRQRVIRHNGRGPYPKPGG